MFNSTLFDVIIGLAFVYLLLSLLATALNELMMTYLNARGKTLQMGIQSFIDDTYAGQKLSHLIFQSPQFKKLYRPGSQRLPSYLSNNRFTEIFLIVLHEKHITDRFADDVRALLDLIPAQGSEKREALGKTLKSLEELGTALSPDQWEDVQGTRLLRILRWTWGLIKWVFALFTSWLWRTGKAAARQDTSPSITDLRNDLMQQTEAAVRDLVGSLGTIDEAAREQITAYLTALQAARNRLSEVRSEPLSIEEIRAAVASLKDGDTKALLGRILGESNKSLAKFKFDIEAWYDDVMNRASGWYKRKVQITLLVLGFAISVAFNADTFSIARKLSTDPEARAKLVEMAVAYSGQEAPAPDTTGAPNAEDQLQRIRALHQQINLLTQDEIGAASGLLGMGWSGWDNAYQVYRIHQAGLDSLQQWQVPAPVILALTPLLNERYRGKTVFRYRLEQVLKPEDLGSYEPRLLKAMFVQSGTLTDRLIYGASRFWGWLFTSIAISLGAPFWFDLLKKIIHLRGTEKRPEDKSSRAVQAVG